MDLKPDYLKNKNHHIRDEQIEFEENSHKYTILCDKESTYTSVTTYVHSQFEEFNGDLIIGKMMDSPRWVNNKYYGKTPYEIKQIWDDNRNIAAASGTKIHFDIECYYNNIPVENNSIEYKYFKEFTEKTQHLEAYRTEWTIFDSDLKLAGSIDMVFYNNNDNCYYIYDWKRCKEIKKSNGFNKYSTNPILSDLPDSNYWHYALQLNIYKALLEKNYDIKIAGCFLVSIHPDNKNKSYQLFRVPDLTELIEKLFKDRIKMIKEPNTLHININTEETKCHCNISH